MDLTTPWKEITYVAFDTETTGKFPLVAEIVELAGVKWRGGKIIDKFQTLVKPNRTIGDEVIKIHHITNEMVAQSPKIDAVLPDFDKFIEGSVMMAHRAAYDMGFLALDYDRAKLTLPANIMLDSSLLGSAAFPKSQNFKLATLTELLGIKMETAHRAYEDSLACLEVSLKAMEVLSPNGTLEEVLKHQGAHFSWAKYSMGDLLATEVGSALVVGCRSQLVLEIVYKGGTQAGMPRRVTPFGLVRNPLGDYIVATCHRENIEKKFYINRIASAKILD